MRTLANSGAGDPDLLAAWHDLNGFILAQNRASPYARMRDIVLDRAYAIPFGAVTQVQGVRSRVKGYVPFWSPRLSNVWLDP